MSADKTGSTPASTGTPVGARQRVTAWARSACRALPVRPVLTRSGARLLIAAFLAVKVALTIWNAATFTGGVYDQYQHEWRARELGLKPNARQYDGPMYYLPAAFVGARPGARHPPSNRVLLGALRWSNVVYLSIFYLCWVGLVFPGVLPDWRSSFVASSILLATPGYQVDAAMVHPDNLLAALVAVAMALWLKLWKDPPQSRLGQWGGLVALSLVIGLMGPTRVLGAAPLGVMLVFAVVLVARKRRLLSGAFLSRAALVGGIVLPLALAWPVFRWHETRKVGFVAQSSYVDQYIPYRKNFDFVHYFTTFYFTDLLRTPNRLIGHANIDHPNHYNKYANSFFTVAYSNTWGDHWLYFSGRPFTEHKTWPKRLAFLAAFPLVLLLPFRVFSSLFRLGKSAISRREPWRAIAGALPQLLTLGMLVGGTTAYLYWQTGSGLLPGKNSTIKFLYNAYLYPFAVGVVFLAPLGKRRFNIWVVYAILLFALTLEVAMWWPNH